MKTIIRQKKAFKLPYFALLGILIVMTALLIFRIMYAYRPSIYQALILGLMDALIIYSPFIFIKRRIWILFVPSLIFTTICLIELIYMKFFGTLIPGSTIKLIGHIDKFILFNAFSVLEWRDIFYLMPPVLILVVWILKKKKILELTPLSTGQLVSYISLAVISICLSLHDIIIKYDSIEQPDKRNSVEKIKYMINTFKYGNYFNGNKNGEILTTLGFNYYVIRTMFDIFSKPLEISAEETNTIEEYFEQREMQYNANLKPLFNDCKGSKNLILIIVESLNAAVLENPYKNDICPFICELINDTTTILCNVKPQISHGRSSDAQFMYNTGLLPLQDEALVVNYSFADYPSLSKALDYYSIEIIGEWKGMWRHEETSFSYGFDELYSNQATFGINKDLYIFENSIKIIEKVQNPFYIEITTLSMHSPYDSNMVSDDLLLPTLSNQFSKEGLNYLQAFHCFDKGLEMFISSLKRIDKYDNSIIVIVGDHPVKVGNELDELNNGLTTLIILNSGKEKNMRIINQIDIFPTILDLMNITTYKAPGINANYRGVGKSIFDSTEYTTQTNPYDISELLIKSRFFNFKK